MAHFAQLDENNAVIQVIVVNNDVILDENNEEQESIGIDFCRSIYGADTNWKQTSYNGTFRNQYAAIGGTYDETNDAFRPLQPFDSWIWNETNWDWDPPTPYPSDEQTYDWNEETETWDLITE